MKSILILSLFVALNCFATAEEDSQALSQSFNTVPLGRTDHGFVTVNSEDEATQFDSAEKERLFLCKQDPKKCKSTDLDKEASRKTKK